MRTQAENTEKLESVQKLLYQIALIEVRNHGGNFDDTMSEVYWQFMQAVERYQEAEASLAHWVKMRIELCLIERRRRFATKASTRLHSDVDVETVRSKDAPQFSLPELKGKLRKRAQFVVSLLTEYNVGFCRELADKGEETPRRVRSQLFKQLRAMGWTKPSIRRAFQEVREAL